MFPESHGFVAMKVIGSIKDTFIHLISEGRRNLTGTTTKPRLSRSMLPNIKTCENGWSKFSENLRIVALKLLELTRFLSPNL